MVPCVQPGEKRLVKESPWSWLEGALDLLDKAGEMLPMG